MNKKAIKIDLSIFFDDERRLSCVLVDPNWENVACLQKKIERLFDVDSVRFLSDGCFLPPQESIEILKFCSDIKAFVPKESYELRKKKKSDKLNNIQKLPTESGNEFDQQNVDGMQKKRKYNSLENNSTLCDAKRYKNRFLEITNKNEEVPQEIENKSKIKVTPESREENQSVGLKSQITDNSSNLEENTLIPVISEDQYKGHHASTTKKTKSEMVKNNKDRTLNTEAERALSTFLNESSKIIEPCDNVHDSSNSSEKNPFKKPKSSRAHKYFNESGEIVSPSIKTAKSKSAPKKDREPKTIVIFRCPLSDVTNDSEPQKPRIFHLISKNTAKKAPKKEVVEIQEEIILPTSSKQSVAEELPLSNEKTDASEVEQKETNETTTETDTTDSLNEQGSLNNTIIPTEDEKKEKDSTSDLKESQNEETKVTKTINETQSEQKSIMSVDCVDLSIDLDDDDIEVEKNKTRGGKLKQDVYEKHDLTADDENNYSSASDVEEISEIIDLNETEDTCSTTANNSMQPTFKEILVDKILPFSTTLKRLPNTDDIIVFKVPYLNEKKNLVNTNFMAGKVEYINKRTKCIKILIIDGVSELCHIPNQFICNLDDSQDYIKYLQLKLKDMREAKLYSIK